MIMLFKLLANSSRTISTATKNAITKSWVPAAVFEISCSVSRQLMRMRNPEWENTKKFKDFSNTFFKQEYDIYEFAHGLLIRAVLRDNFDNFKPPIIEPIGKGIISRYHTPDSKASLDLQKRVLDSIDPTIDTKLLLRPGSSTICSFTNYDDRQKYQDVDNKAIEMLNDIARKNDAARQSLYLLFRMNTDTPNGHIFIIGSSFSKIIHENYSSSHYSSGVYWSRSLISWHEDNPRMKLELHCSDSTALALFCESVLTIWGENSKVLDAIYTEDF